MTKRRRAREFALQMLFQHEFIRIGKFAEFWQGRDVPKDVKDYAEHLVRGTVKHQDELDQAIKVAAEHWAVDRMAAVDRNILRLGAFEILYGEDIPHAVAINEALEIAKRFSTTESASFINGILDRIAREKRKHSD